MVLLRGLGSLLLLLAVPASASVASLRSRSPRMPLPPKFQIPTDRTSEPVISRNGTVLPPYNHTYYFDQLIDHDHPNLGTFKQRYYFTYEQYEAGGPVILLTPGETNFEGYETYLTNKSISGAIAQQENGAGVVIEHRFFGYSNPRDNLSVESLELLTIDQAIKDLTYFAQNVNLPMPGGDTMKPDSTPWVLVGGSYAGTLTAFTKVTYPDVFCAAHATSAPIESMINFWRYFDIARQYMPQNCSKDLDAATVFMDSVFESGDEKEIAALENTFNMTLSHPTDWVGAISDAVVSWQYLQPTDSESTFFFEFCDALEVKDGVIAGPEGWGVQHAVEAFGEFWATTAYNTFCPSGDTEYCFETYNTSLSVYTDISVNNDERSWMWFVCTTFAWFEIGAPEGTPTVVSRLITADYWEHLCVMYFPERFPSPAPPDVNATNAKYGGWGIQGTNLILATGKRDPWLDVTIRAEGVDVLSTPEQPILESDGFHCSDLYMDNGVVDPTVAAVQQQVLAYMKLWIADFKSSRQRRSSSGLAWRSLREGLQYVVDTAW